MRRPQTTVAELAGAHGPAIRALVDELCALVEATIPELTSKANPGWHAITYRHPDAGYVVGVFPFDDRVDLIFERGAELSDPDGVLEGDHLKQVRYVRLEPGGSIPQDGIVRLLHSAVHLGALRRATVSSKGR